MACYTGAIVDCRCCDVQVYLLNNCIPRAFQTVLSCGPCPSADINTVTMVPSPCLDRRFDLALGNHRSAITALWTTKAPTTLKIAWCTRRSTTRRISTIRLWLKNGKLPAPTTQRCDHATLSRTPLWRYLVEFRLSDT